MAIIDQNVNIYNFIRLSEGGVQVTTFAEIRDTLINQMKYIYGEDIDISSATADGQWINQIALMINNMCQVIKYSYDMLDPASATGKYLDVLCSFNNISRKPESSSTVQLEVMNVSGVEQNDVKSIQFVDKNGTYWTWVNDIVEGEVQIKWEVGKSKVITGVTCDTSGPIIALGTHTKVDWDNYNINDAGTINQTVNYGIWKVYQQEDAVVGNIEETDASLRTRRIQSSGTQAISILSGLESALLNIVGIKDVWIYNSIKQSNDVMDDNTILPLNSTYVCVRYNKDDDLLNPLVSDSIIGSLIYNKLTPGIPTIKFDPDSTPTDAQLCSGISGKYDIAKSSSIIYSIYWKKCQPYVFAYHGTISEMGVAYYYGIKISLDLIINNFDFATGMTNGKLHNAETAVEKSIRDNILNYMNNLQLGEDLSSAMLITYAQRGDIYKDGLPTFFVKSADIVDQISGTGTVNTLNLLNTYLSVDEDDIYFSTPNSGTVYASGYLIVKVKTLYSITCTLSNLTSTGNTKIAKDRTAYVQLIPDEHYSLPAALTSVTNADYEYDENTGYIKLTNATGNVTITASGVSQ